MKHIYPAYSKPLRTAIEAVNAAIAHAKTEREAAAAERERLESEALSGQIDVGGLRQRADACRERRLAADLTELKALKSLDALTAAHKRDLSAEADKQAAAAAKRASELEKKAAEMDAGPLLRNAMWVEDAALNACEMARLESQTAAGSILPTRDDFQRIAELERDVAAQVLDLLR